MALKKIGVIPLYSTTVAVFIKCLQQLSEFDRLINELNPQEDQLKRFRSPNKLLCACNLQVAKYLFPDEEN